MGLGLFGGGVGVTRFLVKAGARVTVTDMKTPHDLRESVAALEGLPIELHLAGHREADFRDADFVVTSPAVPADSPWLGIARARETEMNLFFKLCPARRIVGVTGSNGKTTTTALIGEILRRGPRRSWVGGNIGGSLLEDLEKIGPDDGVVLELSSFQLESLDALRRSPNVSVVTNITPNHLDRHGTMEKYVAAKRAIVAHQGEGDLRVLNADDAIVRAFEGAGTAWFSLKGRVDGAWVEGERIHVGDETLDVSRRRLPGWFNLQNMAAAAAATARAFPGWREAAEGALVEFKGVEHRLEFVGEVGGVKYFNDSIATNPESTLAALDTLAGPIVIILGGYDKRLPFEALGRRVRERCRAAVLVGATAGAIEAAIGTGGCETRRAGSFEEAVGLARG
ncbi:MAG: UDP-N-acetylmuramoyl-L-alanine--D-glutamate ligase, partial [Planctomycetes bacterium]|nr:UDP-N-acetylmuramoyl-L-alanine--D-glutamate ligase [Planctomycetota bacterium]